MKVGIIRNACRLYGMKGLAGRCVLKVLSAVGIRLKVTYLYRKRLGEVVDEDCTGYRELFLPDFEKQVSVNPERFTPEKMRRVRQSFGVEGNHAYGIYDGEVLAAYAWTATRWLITEEHRLRDDTGFLWDDYTHPAYRGRGLHGKLVRIRERELVKAGKTVALVTVAFYNRASKVAFERAGYVVRSKLYAYSIGSGPLRSKVRKVNTDD